MKINTKPDFSNKTLENIAKKFGTPTFVYSAEVIRRQIQNLKTNLNGLNFLVCYACKANSNIAILKLLKSEGIGLDLVSSGELFRAKTAGFTQNNLIFSGVGKTKDEITAATTYGGHGVYSIQVESIPELELITEIAKAKHKIINVGLRFNPDVNAKTHPYIATGLKSGKFGLSHFEIQKALELISASSHLKLIGLSFHIGSQINDTKPFDEAISKTFQVYRNLPQNLRESIEYIDVGGGFAIPYEGEGDFPMARFGAMIKKHFLSSGLRVLLEPGRYLVGQAGCLVTKVLYKKLTPTKQFAIVDAAMNDLIRPALYQSKHEMALISKTGGSPQQTSFDVVGPVCESSDFLGKDVMLDNNLAAGDLLAISNAGAYAMSMSSQYNSRPRAAEVLTDGRKTKLVRKRETFGDLIRAEVW